MTTVTVADVQNHLPEIIDKLSKLSSEEEIVIVRDGQPVATLRVVSSPMPRKQRQLGTLKGSVLHMAPDFDAIPEGFEEYVE